MTEQTPTRTSDPQACVQFALERLGKHLIVAAPLALGKPNHLVNAFYRHARAHPELRLDIFTALSLNPPNLGSGLQRRFLEPFMQRHFGEYPRLDYIADLENRAVPDNINISEFYFRSGSRMHDAHSQRHYVSSNYTHVARDMQARKVNVLLQMVATHPDRPGHFSLSGNPDVTLDLVERMAGKLLLIAQTNPDLPYMAGDAEVPEAFFDLVLEDHPQPLFAVPRMPVSDQDFMIGLYTSALIRDGGTLQLGIGTLGDAVCFFTGIRGKDNAVYLRMLESAGYEQRIPGALVRDWGGTEPFDQGLFAASEMFTEGFLHLYDDGILRRFVYDHAELQQLINAGELSATLAPDTLEVLWRHKLIPAVIDQETLDWLQAFGVLDPSLSLHGDELRTPDGLVLHNDMVDKNHREALARAALGDHLTNGAVLHAAFFLGSHWMYDKLKQMSWAERNRFQMTRVSSINQLYESEAIDRVQRLEGRFINTTMKVTLLGAAVSDQLEDGQVVSGVGGQYNFVAMAHALERGRSILLLRSFYGGHKAARSNIVWDFPHATIPRHLRDIVITEYGVVDLRGASDEEVIQSLLCVADSRWQESLRRQAVDAGKLDPAWRIPQPCRNNSPERVKAELAEFRDAGIISAFPYGSDFTAEEIRLAGALAWLRERSATRFQKLALVAKALGARGRHGAEQLPCLQRMGLEKPGNLHEKLERRLLCLALNATGDH